MRKTRFALVLPLVAGSLAPCLALPARAQVRADDPPTVVERIQEKVKKNPELGKVLRTVPSQMEEVSWMAGEWDVVEKRYATPLSPEMTRKGKRRASFELGGRWLVSRDAFDDKYETRSYLAFIANRATWLYQFFASDGVASTVPLVSQDPWVNGRIELSGTLWYAGDNAQMGLRIVKTGDSFLEVWEESLAGGRIRRPIVEFSLTRRK